jgi:V-type H+-transporting ATPase 16kDa proteolipid subunit
MGCAIAMVFTAMGASYGMAKSGIGVMAAGILRPDKVMQSESGFQVLPEINLAILVWYADDLIDMMPPIMASIVSIYGLVIAVIISNALKEKSALFTGFIQLGAGISVGVSGLATGYDISNIHGLQCRRG